MVLVQTDYDEAMKAALPLLIIVSSVLVGTVVQAQIRVPQGVRNAAGDWHVVKNKDHIFRFDARTGLTQQMTVISQTKGFSHRWDTVTEDASASPASGQYEVIEGNNKDAMAVRIERASGRTWIMYGINGGVSRWEVLKTQ